MAKDKYHQLVKKALIAEGWSITHDPLFVPTLKRTMQVDLGAERLIGAEKGNQQIAIEPGRRCDKELYWFIRNS